MHPEIKKTEKNMKIQQIRNATIKIEYAGKVMLIDPMLGEKGCMPPFPFSHHQELRNPIHDLPMTVDELLRDVDCVLLTHLHTDHIDDAAYEQLPKEMLIVVQDELDREVVVSHGFKQVKVIDITATGGCCRRPATPAAMCSSTLRSLRPIWLATPSGIVVCVATLTAGSPMW